MLRSALALALLPILVPSTFAAEPSKPMVTGLKNPTAVAIGPDGRVYVAVLGEPDKAGDGAVLAIVNGQAQPFATGLDDPTGLVTWKDSLYVVDKNRVVRIDRAGKTSVYVAADAFPTPPQFLNDITVDERGALYVTDSGETSAGAIFRILPPPPRGRAAPKVERAADVTTTPRLQHVQGVAMDGMSHLLLTDQAGRLQRLRLFDGSLTELAQGAGGGVTWDWRGRLYFTDHNDGRVLVIPRPREKPVVLAAGFQEPAGMCVDAEGKNLLVVDTKVGTLTALPAQVPGAPVDESPLPLTTALAFPKLEWSGWSAEPESGKVIPLRPIVLTHAGDGSNRVFVATQHGVIHVFPNDQQATKTQIFFDMQAKVRYDDNANEEGFLGLAFHPNYKSNGEFFVFYTDKKAKLTNVVSRFRVSKDDPNRADPASEEELLRIPHKYWNHDGGTICFGPDGYLYIAVGDGGSANDPDNNGQNLRTILGKILRIDVNRKDAGKPYAIPRDNPFVGRTEAKQENYAYGLRNVWRMAFDRKTGKLWAGEVGQNLYEEVNIIEKGGNYGWNARESLHPFGPTGADVRTDLIDPIWEYHHDIGKSITGGSVYRGTRLPELDGHYLYSDYVSGRIWALKYDDGQKRVVANRPINGQKLPWMSFGEDERGEVYVMTYTPTGQGLHWFVRPGGK
jgi:glucose/arabinose dehydrogenase